jgi:hypothetical protein
MHNTETLCPLAESCRRAKVLLSSAAFAKKPAVASSQEGSKYFIAALSGNVFDLLATTLENETDLMVSESMA